MRPSRTPPKASTDNIKWSPRRAEPGAWVLRGLVRCGLCGVGTSCHKMRGRNGTWHRYYYYCCHNHTDAPATTSDHPASRPPTRWGQIKGDYQTPPTTAGGAKSIEHSGARGAMAG